MIESYVDQGYSEIVLNRLLFSLLKDSHMKESVQYGEKVIQNEKDIKFMEVLATRHKWLGNKERYKAIKQDINKLDQSNIIGSYYQNLEEIYHSYGVDEAEVYLQQIVSESPKYTNQLYKKFFTIAKDRDLYKALEYAEKVLTVYNDPAFLSVVIKRYNKIGQKTKALVLEKAS